MEITFCTLYKQWVTIYYSMFDIHGTVISHHCCHPMWQEMILIAFGMFGKGSILYQIERHLNLYWSGEDSAYRHDQY